MSTDDDTPFASVSDADSSRRHEPIRLASTVANPSLAPSRTKASAPSTYPSRSSRSDAAFSG